MRLDVKILLLVLSKLSEQPLFKRKVTTSFPALKFLVASNEMLFKSILKMNLVEARYLFDNSKLLAVCEYDFEFIPMAEGIKKCCREYCMLSEDQKIKTYQVMFDAWLDRSTGRKVLPFEYSIKEKAKYLGYFYVPQFMKSIKNVKRFIKRLS